MELVIGMCIQNTTDHMVDNLEQPHGIWADCITPNDEKPKGGAAHAGRRDKHLPLDRMGTQASNKYDMWQHIDTEDDKMTTTPLRRLTTRMHRKMRTHNTTIIFCIIIFTVNVTPRLLYRRRRQHQH